MPNTLQRLKDRLFVVNRRLTLLLVLRFVISSECTKQSYRMLSVIVARGTEFIENAGFLFPRSFFVSNIYGFEIFFSGSRTHSTSLPCMLFLGNMHYESTILFLFTSGNILCESIRWCLREGILMRSMIQYSGVRIIIR